MYTHTLTLSHTHTQRRRDRHKLKHCSRRELWPRRRGSGSEPRRVILNPKT